jgi:hypothetical protein
LHGSTLIFPRKISLFWWWCKPTATAPPASSWQPPAVDPWKAPPARRRGRSLGTSGARSWEETMVITIVQ